jgi:predicted O-methyltransferase YrrM
MSQIIALTLQHLKKLWLENHIPNITEENAEFLKKLIQKRSPKHILEIGTANGYSTLHFASVIAEWSDITTIEQAWNMHNFAVENFRNCKLKCVHAIWWDAKRVIPSLADGYYDIVYIDAMKREYLEYLLACIPKMTPDALIVIDDVEKFRDKMEDLYDWLEDNHVPYRLEKTDTDDSIMVIQGSDIVLR